MGKVLLAMLTVSLIAIAIVPTACSNSAPVNYSTYTLRGVAFSYPSDWTDGTIDLENMLTEDEREYMSMAGWYTESDSAMLVVMTMDVEAAGIGYSLTESDKEAIATSMVGSMTTVLDQPTIVGQSGTTVNGQWAWEMEFTGDFEGDASKGYELTVVSDDTVFALFYAGWSSGWGNLKEVYNTVKNSIAFH